MDREGCLVISLPFRRTACYSPNWAMRGDAMNIESNQELAALLIERLCAGRDNRLGPNIDEAAWAKPLVGFCRGDDSVFLDFKQAVGPFHWTPQEAYRIAFPDATAKPGDLALIVWILPQTEATKKDNRAETRYPSERWARSRIFGEAFNDRLRAEVARELTERGYPAAAPMQLAEFHVENTDRYGPASTWSERHMAFAAGLGTFGLCDGLITPAGKAIRAGSVVAKMPVEPAGRPYTDHNAYCLYLSGGTCGDCIARCPVGAISPAGHDKTKCSEYLNNVTRPHVTGNFGFAGYGCGLCQTGVPCESGIPSQSTDSDT